MAEQLSDDQVRQQFPAYAWLLNIPEIRNILADPSIINDPSAATRIQAKIQGTNWWRATEPSLRSYEQLKAQDPEGLNQQQRQKEADIWDLYTKAGLKPDVPAVQALATQALQHNWNTTQLNDAVVGHATYSPEMMNQVGTLQSTATALKQKAQAYYVPLDDQTAFNWAKSIAAGQADQTAYENQLIQNAKNRFSYSPGVTSALDKGMTTADYFQPYQATAAKLLEVNPNSIDLLSDPKWNKILDFTDPKTNARREMTLPEMQTFIRGTDQWRHQTKQGQQAAADMTQGVLEMFGKSPGASSIPSMA